MRQLMRGCQKVPQQECLYTAFRVATTIVVSLRFRVRSQCDVRMAHLPHYCRTRRRRAAARAFASTRRSYHSRAAPAVRVTPLLCEH